jgi:serine/threonine protein kinase
MMQKQRFLRAQDLFHQACELAPEQRVLFIHQKTANDPPLRALCIGLLNSHEAIDTFDTQATVHNSIDHWSLGILNQSLKRYRIITKINEGGMGCIYLAERNDDEYQKRVVIKVHRQGHHSTQSNGQLRYERQILAQLEHPNIVPLLDGGTTQDGQVYAVMPYIRGRTITQYCLDHQLSYTQRLTLFITLCDAIQYAHQQTVIHGDIKPNNVLVDEQGRIQLLDFGVAQRNHDANASGAAQTQQLTPRYASPEHFAQQTLNTSSDTYALGLLLFELLSDTPPSPIKKQKPSNKPPLSQARLNATELAPLSRELQAVLTKATQHKPQDRYATAQALSGDIQAYLSGHPVQAYPSTWRYRARLFLKRHKKPVAGVSAFLFVLIAAIFALTWQAMALHQQHRQARHEQQRAEAVTQLLIDAFASADPSKTMGEKVLAKDILQHSVQHIDEQFSTPSTLKAQLQSHMAEAYLHLGIYPQAEALIDPALDYFQQLNPSDTQLHHNQLNKLQRLKAELTLEWHADYQLAEQFAQRAQQTNNAHGRWAALSLLAKVYSSQDRDEESIQLLQTLVNEQEQQLGVYHIDTLKSQYQLARLMLYQDQQQEALEKLKAIQTALIKHSSQAHHLRTQVFTSIAYFHRQQKNYEHALNAYQQAHQQYLAIYGPTHPLTHKALEKIAITQYRLGHTEESLALFQQHHRVIQDLYGADHILSAFAKHNLANIFSEHAIDNKKAEQLYLSAITIAKNHYQEAHNNLGIFHRSLAQHYQRLQQHTRAIHQLQQALQQFQQKPTPKQSNLARTRLKLAESYWALADTTASRQQLAQAMPLLQQAYDDDHPTLMQATQLLHELDMASKNTNQATTASVKANQHQRERSS